MSERVLVVGGGFGGLYAARALARAPVQVTVVDRRNYHLFQPLLYQVAIGGLAPSDVAAPLRWILRKQENADVCLAQVTDLDPEHRTVRAELPDGDTLELGYDHLIIASGASHHYFGNDAWASSAPGLKTLRDATGIRARVLRSFELADRESDPALRAALLTFVVVGGGPTGVELAGALAELARDTLRKDYRGVDLARTRVVLVEGGQRLLSSFREDLSARAKRDLEGLGVEVWLEAMVEEIGDEHVTVRRGDERERLDANTVMWAAGVKGSELGELLRDRLGAQLDRAGRVVVEPDFSLPGRPEVRVIGDLARYDHSEPKPLPGVAPVAMQAGRFVASDIRRTLAGKPRRTFRYRDKGNLATIGRSHAVAQFGRRGFGGWFAWMLWLVVHLAFLVGYANRAIVLFKWAVAYFTFNRGARLILPVERARSDALD